MDVKADIMAHRTRDEKAKRVSAHSKNSCMECGHFPPFVTTITYGFSRHGAGLILLIQKCQDVQNIFGNSEQEVLQSAMAVVRAN